LGGVEPDDVGGFAGGEAGYAFAVFGVPEFHLAIEGGGEELGSGGIECGVCYRFRMARIRAEKFSIMVDVP
jgi:hypothetical protein